jgi:hypothetical protein
MKISIKSCGMPKVQFLSVAIAVPQLFLVCNSAIVLVVRNIAELRKWGLKLRMPTFKELAVSKRHVCPKNKCIHD